MELSKNSKASIFLDSLIGNSLQYALKLPDTELYEFAFGKIIEAVNRHGETKKIGTYILHVLCRFKVIWRNREHRVDKYYEDTPKKDFEAEIQRLIGLTVKRIGLSDKNDLWLDLGDYWIVFATFEDGEESWRYFAANSESPHLVASDVTLEFE